MLTIGLTLALMLIFVVDVDIDVDVGDVGDVGDGVDADFVVHVVVSVVGGDCGPYVRVDDYVGVVVDVALDGGVGVDVDVDLL